MSKGARYWCSRASLPMKPERTLRAAGSVSRLAQCIILDPPEDALCTSRGRVYHISGRPLPNRVAREVALPSPHTTEHAGRTPPFSGCAGISRRRCQVKGRAAPLPIPEEIVWRRSIGDPCYHVKSAPAGLDPVTVGRFGLWLLGKRNHFRAMRRSISASRVSSCGLAASLCLDTRHGPSTSIPGATGFCRIRRRA